MGTEAATSLSNGPMMTFSSLGFVGVGLTVIIVAWITLAILLVALLAASASNFFRSVDDFDTDVREATMEMAPAERRRFFEIYASLHPKNPAVAWFLAVGLGPIGTNLYRGKWATFAGALVTLNGLGAWWLESIFTAPYLVIIENRATIAYALRLLHDEPSGAHGSIGHGTPLRAVTELVAS